MIAATAPLRAAATAIALAFAVFLSPPARALVPDHFESPAVHPVELSPDGTRLFVAHTADHRLVVFDLTGPAPSRIAEIQVGIEPVTVRARTNSEVWVVNHLSDSISIIDLSLGSVIRTLLVGDEPTDVVFVPKQHRAFVCVSQEDELRVFDTNDLTIPPVHIPLSMSDPRSLALSPDGTTIYVGALDGQNRTTTVPFQTVRMMPGTLPTNPPMRPELPPPPQTALILKHDGTKWTDEIGRDWNSLVPYQPLDHDIIRVSTSSLAVQGAFTGVGTTLFNLAVNPSTGRIYASTQDATNHIRFEPNVRGKFLRNFVMTIDPTSGVVAPSHLNIHINYEHEAGDPAERSLSLAIPMDLVVSSDGSTVYVAAFGSRKVGVLDANGDVTRRIVVGDGPCGLALDEPRNRLYVMNRFSSTLAVVALGPDAVSELPLGFDPTPAPIREGRHFLYDGEFSSAHGDLACASCHVFGGMDGIAWDLGNPEGEFIRPVIPELNGFHPMKGPMVTQSLKAMQDTGPLHWRGDRPTFFDFNLAFVQLLGRQTTIDGFEIDLFQQFVFSMRYPPNPNRELDDALPALWNGADPRHGEDLFLNAELPQDGTRCVDCHGLPAGTGGHVFTAEMLSGTQDVKAPHLRNVYEKTRFDRASPTMVRGIGFEHDGALDDLSSFHRFTGFTFPSDSDRNDVAAFLMAFNSGTPAAVGAQWTMDGTNESDGADRLQTLIELADADVVGLVAKARDDANEMRGWVYAGAGAWRSDRAAEPETTTPMAGGAGHEVTFTAVLDGTELRLGIDRDEDGWFDRDEIDVGSDPGDPLSTPGSVGAPELSVAPAPPALWNLGMNPASDFSRFGFSLSREGMARLDVYDLSGRRVRSLVSTDRHAPGRFESSWDLRDEGGRTVAPGVYFVRLESLQGDARSRVVVLR